MVFRKVVKKSRLLLVSVAALLCAIWPAAAFAATDPFGGSTVGNFAVLAGTTITNTGPSVIAGQIGVSPGSAITGFPPGTSGPQHKADPVALQAQTDLAAAYTNASGQPCPATNNKTGQNLGGMTLVPGVYCQTTAAPLTGTLTLNGAGIYIFQIIPATTLVTAPSSRVVLTNGALPCQVFWVVGSSATIASSTTFVGNVMTLQSISMQTGASLEGRALARNGAVTLDTNRITQPTGCGYPAAVASPAPSPTGLPNASGPPQQHQPGFPWLPIGLAVLGLAIIAAVVLNHLVGSRLRSRTG